MPDGSPMTKSQARMKRALTNVEARLSTAPEEPAFDEQTAAEYLEKYPPVMWKDDESAHIHPATESKNVDFEQKFEPGIYTDSTEPWVDDSERMARNPETAERLSKLTDEQVISMQVDNPEPVLKTLGVEVDPQVVTEAFRDAEALNEEHQAEVDAYDAEAVRLKMNEETLRSREKTPAQKRAETMARKKAEREADNG
jgi:hypothetical protein